MSHNQKFRVYDRQVAPTAAKKKEEKKPATPLKVTSDASKNKEKTPVVKVESPTPVSANS
ncbi:MULTISPECIES: hypothetical protein [unclassified Acinetobacter]|uniref:hypothetical protein n=1 Tax=unclassified Acinetobacter TaxID=196816 RepID=UPI002A18D62E|nr:MULTISPECIES: hypothetical protein [unclassified Acinetobacter]